MYNDGNEHNNRNLTGYRQKAAGLGDKTPPIHPSLGGSADTPLVFVAVWPMFCGFSVVRAH